jgi:hypothetical protein
MSTHRFARTSLYADYGRAALGFALTFGPLVLLDPAPVLAWLFGGLALLFAWFGLRTLLRQMSRVEVGPGRILLIGPRPREIRWEHLREVRLSYFAPRRLRRGREADPSDGAEGWLQLSLIDRGGQRLDLDSTLDDFTDILARAHRAVRARDLPVDPATSANFAAVGLSVAEPSGGVSVRPSPPPEP